MHPRLQAVALGLLVGHAYLLAVRVAEYGAGTDFLAFFTAAQMLASDPAANPYLTPAFVQAQGLAEGANYWLSPPTALLLFAPFGGLSFSAALGAWLALGVAAWVAAHALLSRHVVDASLPTLLSVGLVLTPLTIWLQYGQATALALLVLTATYVLLLRGREGAAGLVLSLLAFKPQLAVGMALALAVKGRWRALAAGAAGLAAQVGLTAVWWPAQWGHFFGALGSIRAMLLGSGDLAWGVHTLDGFWRLLGAPDGVATASVLAVAAALALAWRHVPWAPETADWRRAMAATVAAGLLLGVHLWTYDLGLLLLPGCILAGLGDRSWRPVAAVLLVGPPLAYAMHTTAGAAVQITTPAVLWAAWRAWPRRDHAALRRVGWPALTRRTPSEARLARGIPALTMKGPSPATGSGSGLGSSQ